MKKIHIAVLIFVALWLICSACTPVQPSLSPEPTATATPTPEPTPVATPELTPQATDEVRVLDAGTVVYAYHGGSGRFSYDLDFDNVMEEIAFTFYDYNDEPVEPFDLVLTSFGEYYFGVYSCDITIGDQTLKLTGEELEPIIMVVDVDRTDQQMELCVGEYGPSDDYFTTVIAYHDGKLSNVGYIPGVARGALSIDGTGVIHTPKRGSILHTWFYPAQYAYDLGQLTQIQYDTYPMNNNVTMLQELTLVTSPTDNTPADTLHVGDMVTIVSTDDKAWCYVEAVDGRKGWFEVTEFSNINGKFAYEIFDGLSFAD